MSSKSGSESSDVFSACKSIAEKFFGEIEKSTPKYHQMATDLQKNYLEAWKNVINSSISFQQEIAAKSGMNVDVPKKYIESLQNMTEQAMTAYKNQNSFGYDSAEASKKLFDAFNENTKIFASLNKNMMELMESVMKQNTSS